MLLLITCFIVNSLIGVIFKFFDKYSVDNNQAITCNYFVCVITGSIVLGRFALPFDLFQKEWFWLAVFMGFLFVFTFNLMALTVQHFGVGVATIFQKMSLIAPAMIALFWYNETTTLTKLMGIVLAITSVLLLSYKKNGTSEQKLTGWIVFLPLSIFLGSCVVDSGLFLVEKEKLAPNGDIEFVSSLFFFAGFFGLIQLLFDKWKGNLVVRPQNILGGIALGIPNFFSIYLLLLLLAKGWEGSVVFPVNNVGVLLMAAVFGLLLFRERWNKQKISGFLLATLAIILMAL